MAGSKSRETKVAPLSRAAKRGLLQSSKRFFLSIVIGQWPVIFVIGFSLLAPQFIGIYSESYRLIILALLVAVVYAAYSSGLRQGLVSAVLAVLFNTYILSNEVVTVSINDDAVRSILLLVVVLPGVASVIGYLKERNDFFLAKEKQARTQAEKSEQRLRFMAEAMPQKIFTANPSGKIDYLNQQWLEYSGLTFKELKSNNFTIMLHRDDNSEVERRWWHSMETGEPFQVESRLKRADGKFHWHLTRAEALRSNQGKIIMWVGSSTDIEDVRRTRRLEANTKQLIEERRQLKVLNKAKDEFISLASHQLRTPATGVKQYIGMLLEGYAGKISKQQRSMLRHAFDSNEREITIINDLLRVAQLDAGKVHLHVAKTNMTSLIQDVLDEQKSAFKARQQTITFAAGKTSIMAPIDAARMRMVLENLIDNAGKYTPDGKKIEVGLAKKAGRVLVTVADEGIGIEPEDKEKIFEKFARLESPLSVAAEGSGLGLYWTKQIIDLHGGSISVDSKPGEGSTFTLSLPA